jgi:hypothetical protein
LPRPANDPQTDSLPDPELNPLLNPLLAANMGRWAEVYFTSPPEKREEAVTGLLRELGGRTTESVVPPIEDSSGENNRKIETETEPMRNESLPARDNFPEETYHAGEAARACGACGHINSEGQNFCGMCGTRLQSVSGEVNPDAAIAPPWDEQEIRAGPSLDNISAESAHGPVTEPAPKAHIESRDFVSFFPENTAEGKSEAVPVAESSQEQPIPERLSQAELPQFAREAEPAPDSRYRLYVGIVLACLLTLLVYMAWRGTKAISSSPGTEPPASRVIPQAPPAVSEQPQVASPERSADQVPVGKIRAHNPAASGTAPNGEHTASVAAQPTSARAASKPPSPKKRSAPTKSTKPVVAKASNASSIASSQSGSEELATAESYLNGTQGRSRDPREAAQWLWRSIGKGNASATIVLSDLYLRGEGVAKNCDQARLLLNAAARKGSATAAQRLRNLQAFGCQ